MNKEKIEVLQTANDYMNNLKDGIVNLANMIQEGKEQEAITIIPQVVDGIEWIVQVITLTKEVQKNEIGVEALNDQLQEIIEALENEDYILVGDLFNYEILPILEEIHEGIKETVAN
ncbi:Uncharacterised protein [Clostridium carnis]|uniref:DUF8042 domain-containing protein n=1 Tax=Clostridium carnis TaxID=1530 RepID=A0ABY6SMU6_9CLOT|nr:hypothetical protein [Clostridium carnis]VDG69326.1 Uncharacterised protein [Clostridium carnis]